MRELGFGRWVGSDGFDGSRAAIADREKKSAFRAQSVVKGRLVLGQESNGLRTMIDDLLASGVTRIVVNLEHVNYVDSAGLGALIEMHRKTKAKGGGLKLCNLGPNLRQALEIARLLPIFETCPTETAAVASF